MGRGVGCVSGSEEGCGEGIEEGAERHSTCSSNHPSLSVSSFPSTTTQYFPGRCNPMMLLLLLLVLLVLLLLLPDTNSFASPASFCCLRCSEIFVVVVNSTKPHSKEGKDSDEATSEPRGSEGHSSYTDRRVLRAVNGEQVCSIT